MTDFTFHQWLFGALSAWLIGVSKTGVPGMGILVVPLMAVAFGGRLSIGVVLPMLIFADCFAVAWYRRHTQWKQLWVLAPWVIAGGVVGGILLWWLGNLPGRDYLNPIIGTLVLGMLGVNLLRRKRKEHLTPHTGTALAGTGMLAGFATTVSNAAGPVMTLYLAAHRLPKEQFVATNALFFFLVNVSKVPVYLVLTALNPGKPLFSLHGLAFNALSIPAILLGVLMGRWLLMQIRQSLFDVMVISLAALASIQLIFL
jgi:uncharacterized membrane protein YfcA